MRCSPSKAGGRALHSPAHFKHMCTEHVLEILLSSRWNHTDHRERSLQLLPPAPSPKRASVIQSKCLRNTQSMQEVGQFLSTDCAFETQFKPGYRSLLFGECYTAHFQDCQTLCFRIPLPSCTKPPVIQLKTGLLSPISADEAKARDFSMVLHETTGILSAAWLASLI